MAFSENVFKLSKEKAAEQNLLPHGQAWLPT